MIIGVLIILSGLCKAMGFKYIYKSTWDILLFLSCIVLSFLVEDAMLFRGTLIGVLVITLPFKRRNTYYICNAKIEEFTNYIISKCQEYEVTEDDSEYMIAYNEKCSLIVSKKYKSKVCKSFYVRIDGKRHTDGFNRFLDLIKEGLKHSSEFHLTADVITSLIIGLTCIVISLYVH